MRLKKELVHYLSNKIVENLVETKAIEFECTHDDIVELVEMAIINDLMVEDSLNDEVKEILEQQEEKIDEDNINYRKMFQMVKMKLVRERGLIL